MSKSQSAREIERLEQSFWQSMVDGDVKVATGMLTEPAVMVSGHGASKFDHAGYERMAADDRYKLVDYTLSKFDVVFPTEDVAIATYHVAQSMEREGKAVETQAFDSSTWVKLDAGWKCVAHTESPGAAAH
jgi:ketosteroid isomerase-like protein